MSPSSREIEGPQQPQPSYGVVCPGRSVKVRNTKSGEEQSLSILGPWDTDRGDDVVSYRAPLAAGLLGHRVGEKATVNLPTGEAELEVLEVDEITI